VWSDEEVELLLKVTRERSSVHVVINATKEETPRHLLLNGL